VHSPNPPASSGGPPGSLGAYRWAAPGDVNAFFGLILDNVVNLAILAGILVGAFGFPADIVYTRMFPGTALGVMIGDLAYTWLAFRLAKRTGRSDVTAMPFGLDSPSTIGMAFAVLGPAFIAAKARMPVAEAAVLAWQVGMAAMVMIGVFKLAMTFVGDRIRPPLAGPGDRAPGPRRRPGAVRQRRAVGRPRGRTGPPPSSGRRA